VRLLLDNNLSPRLVDVLAKDGWDVVHVGCWPRPTNPVRPWCSCDG
jgi:predicted nuclease of predicted toxin-antitoxin system